jgi:hypothetical protein
VPTYVAAIQGQGWLIALPPVVLFLVLFIVNIKKISFFFASVLRFFGIFSKSVSKKSIEVELSNRIIGTAKELSSELNDTLPHEITIKWKDSSNRDSFLDGKRVVLCMDQSRTRHQNIVHAVSDYVNKGLYPAFFEKMIDGNSVEAQKLVLTRKMLKLVYKAGLRHYNDNIFFPFVQDKNIKKLVQTFETLDNNGMFSHIFIRELVRCANAYDTVDFNEIPENSLGSFVDGLSEFLLNITNSQGTGEYSPLGYTRGPFKVSIGLIAKSEVYSTYGVQWYADRFKKEIKNNYHDIYLCSYGERNNAITIALQKKLLSEMPNLKSSPPYYYQNKRADGRLVPAVTIAFDASAVNTIPIVSPSTLPK